MVDERYDEHEEGEYHFSDDQANYDVVEPEVVKAASSSEKSALMTGIDRYRRLLIGLGVFCVLMFVVYKMLSPASPPQATEFKAAAVAPASPTPSAVTPVSA